MGNCIPGSPGIIGNRTSLLLLDYNYSDYVDYMDNNTDINQDMDINQEDFAAAAPCHNRYCPFFHRAAPPYLIATSVTSLMATAALLLALSLRPKAWPRGRMLVAQLAACCGLFAITLLPMAAGIAWGWQMGEGPCKVALLLWHGSVLAQGLLLGVGCVYCCILLLLPGALLTTAVLRGMWGAMGQKVGWMFWVLWAPHGVVMVVEVLLEVGVIPTSCGAFESFDFALGLSAALGGLHCCLMPLMLLLTAFYGHKVGGEC